MQDMYKNWRKSD